MQVGLQAKSFLQALNRFFETALLFSHQRKIEMRLGKCRRCFACRSKSLCSCVQVAASHCFGCPAKRFGHVRHILGKNLRTTAAKKQTEQCRSHQGSNVSEAARKKFPHGPINFTKPNKKLEFITTSR